MCSSRFISTEVMRLSSDRFSYRDFTCDELAKLYLRLDKALYNLFQRDPSLESLPEIKEIECVQNELLWLINHIDHPGVFKED